MSQIIRFRGERITGNKKYIGAYTLRALASTVIYVKVTCIWRWRNGVHRTACNVLEATGITDGGYLTSGNVLLCLSRLLYFNGNYFNDTFLAMNRPKLPTGTRRMMLVVFQLLVSLCMDVLLQ